MIIAQKKKGIALMIMSALSFAIMQALVSYAGHIPTMEKVFARNLFNMIIAFIIIKKQGGSFYGERKYQGWLMGRSVMGFIGIITLFYASSNASQGDVTILNKLSPIFVTLLAVAFLKENLSKVQVISLVIAFLGATIVIQPRFDSMLLPLLSALLSAIFSGASYTILGYFKDKVNGMTVILHFSTFCTLFSMPLMIKNFVVPTTFDLFILLLIGVFGTLGQITITYSYRFAPASEVSIYNYSGIIFSVLLGYFMLGEGLRPASVIGGILVIMASVIGYLYNKESVGITQ